MTVPIQFTPDLSIRPEVTPFLDSVSNTISYIVTDPETKRCAVIDAVMDFEQASGRLTFECADRMIRLGCGNPCPC